MSIDSARIPPEPEGCSLIYRHSDRVWMTTVQPGGHWPYGGWVESAVFALESAVGPVLVVPTDAMLAQAHTGQFDLGAHTVRRLELLPEPDDRPEPPEHVVDRTGRAWTWSGQFYLSDDGVWELGLCTLFGEWGPLVVQQHVDPADFRGGPR